MHHLTILVSREPTVVHHRVVKPSAALRHELELQRKALEFSGCEPVEVAAPMAELVKFRGQHMVRQHVPNHPTPLAAMGPNQGSRHSAGFVLVAVLVQRTVESDAPRHLDAPLRFNVAAFHGVSHKIAQLSLGI